MNCDVMLKKEETLIRFENWGRSCRIQGESTANFVISKGHRILSNKTKILLAKESIVIVMLFKFDVNIDKKQKIVVII